MDLFPVKLKRNRIVLQYIARKQPRFVTIFKPHQRSLIVDNIRYRLKFPYVIFQQTEYNMYAFMVDQNPFSNQSSWAPLCLPHVNTNSASVCMWKNDYYEHVKENKRVIAVEDKLENHNETIAHFFNTEFSNRELPAPFLYNPQDFFDIEKFDIEKLEFTTRLQIERLGHKLFRLWQYEQFDFDHYCQNFNKNVFNKESLTMIETLQK